MQLGSGFGTLGSWLVSLTEKRLRKKYGLTLRWGQRHLRPSLAGVQGST